MKNFPSSLAVRGNPPRPVAGGCQYLLPKLSINIEKKLTNSKKLIEIPDEMVTISRIDDNNEVQKLLEQHHVNQEISYYNDCK